MSKHNEVKATQHKHDLAGKRELQRKRSRLVAILGCMVVLVTALALMVPAISLSEDAAEEIGVVLDKQADATDEATEPAAEPAAVEAEAPAAAEEPAAEEAEEPAAVEEPAAEEAAPAVDEEAVTEDEGDSDDADASDGDADEGKGDTESKASVIVNTTASSVGAVDPNSEDAENPAQSFTADLKDSNDKVVLTVAVDAPEGAFPAGTFMKIDGIAPDKVQDKVEKAIEDAKGNDVKITNLTAVDIIFRDTDGNEIEPAKKVEVKITTNDVRNFEDPVLVHVLDKSKKSSKGKSDDAEIVNKVSIVNQDENDNSVGAEDTMRFESKAFSPYVIVEYALEAADADADADDTAADADASAQTFQGEAGSVKVTATAPAGALPEGATMDVTAVDAEEIQDAVTQAVEEKEADTTVTQISAVDIKFANAEGDEVQPELPVKVTMTDTAAPESGSAVVARIDDQGNADVVEQSVVTNEANKVIFDAESFPTYAIVGTELVTEITLPGGDDTYEVSVTYGEDAKIPEGAKLSVSALAHDTDEYNKAKEAVVADKKANDAKFDESKLGFAAVDISIVDETGKKVEPAEGAEVKVSFKMKKLPAGTGEEKLAETMEIQHLKESTGKTIVETVAEAEDVAVTGGSALAEFTVTDFSTFTLIWDDGSATIHWGRMNNGTFEEFDAASLDYEASSVSLDTAYANFDYGTAYYCENETTNPVGSPDMDSVLTKKNDSTWEYTSTGTDDDGSTVVNRGTIANGSHIYVVYTPHGSNKPSGADDPNVSGPETKKSVKSNGDGTYEIQLDIIGAVKKEETHVGANVLVVLDTTSSMSQSMTGATNRFEAARSAVLTLIDTLQCDKHDIDLALVEFDNKAGTETVYPWTKDYEDFRSYVADDAACATSATGTNWEVGLREAVSVLANKDKDPTYVIFVTDGEPNRYIADQAGQYWNGRRWVSYNAGDEISNAGADTCRTEAQDEANTISATNNLYGVFCGNATGSNHLSTLITNANGKKTIVATSQSAIENEFKAIAQDIVESFGSTDVSTNDGVTALSHVSATVSGAAGAFKYYTAYEVSYDSATGKYTYVNDAGEKVEVSEGQFETYRGTDGSVSYYYRDRTEWAGAPGASYSEANGVTWDLSAEGLLKEGRIYSVSFTVWPSQEAFDTLANLNNKTVKYEELPEAVQNQIYESGGTYYLKTNTTLNTAYTYNGTQYQDNIPFVQGAMDLESTEMEVRKAFAHDINDVDPYTALTFYLTIDGKYYMSNGTKTTVKPTAESTGYYTMELPKGAASDENNWKDKVFIAPGVIRDHDGNFEVLEPGHKYSLYEIISGTNQYEYEFTPQTVRPMEINGELKYLVLADKYNPVPDGAQTYTIEGETYYVASESNAALIGTNRKTAELDITKQIVDNTGNFTKAQLDAETFTYRVTLTVPEGGDIAGITAYEYVPRPDSSVEDENRFLVFGYQNDEASAIRGLDNDVSRFTGKVYGGYTVTTSTANRQMTDMFVENADGTKTATIDITLKRNEILRFTNLPANTQYTIVEMYNNYRQADPSRDADAGGSTMAANIADQGYVTTIATKSRNPVTNTVRTGGADGTTISGTIDYLDARYYNQFTNTLEDAIDVELTGTKHLDGYEWSGERYYFNLATTNDAPLPIVGAYGRTRFYLTEASGTADKNYSFGKIRFTEAGTYTYTITEDYANTLQVVNGTAVQFGAAETITIVIAESDDGKLSVESVTNNSGNTTWDATNKIADTTITNTCPKVNVTAKKAWLNAAGAEATPPTGAKVTFTLYVDGTADTTKTVELDGTVDQLGEATPWEATFSGLPKHKVETVEGVQTAVEITYTVFEEDSGKWQGYDRVEDKPVANGGTIHNQQGTLWVQFKKVDQSGDNALGGAVFAAQGIGGGTLTSYDPDTVIDEKNVGGLMHSGDDYTFELPMSTNPYVLSETTAPAGYNKLTGSINVYVKENRVTWDGAQQGTASGEGTEKEPFVVTITNNSGVELPVTGGVGTLPITLVGIALITIAGAILLRGRRSRRGGEC